MSLSSTTFGGLITFTRSTTATRTGPTGLIETIATDQPRFDYNPITLAAKGLLIEESRTNLLTYSEQIDNAAWTKSAATITTNTTNAPDGTASADKLVEDNTNAGHTLLQSKTVSASTTYCASIFLKAAERTSARFQLYQNGSLGYYAIYDLSAGTVSAATAFGGAISGSVVAIQQLANGWYRCSITYTGNASATSMTGQLFTVSGGTNSYLGDNSSGLYTWGAQLEAGSYATSYIPTVSAAVTRAADVVDINTLSPWYNANEGTLYAELTHNSVRSDGGTSYPLSLRNSAGTYQISIRAGTVIGGSDLYVMDNNVNQVDTNSFAIMAGTAYKHVIGYKLNDYAFATNNAAPLTDTVASVPSAVSKISLGLSNFNGCIKALKYYPKRLTNTELQALTA